MLTTIDLNAILQKANQRKAAQLEKLGISTDHIKGMLYKIPAKPEVGKVTEQQVVDYSLHCWESDGGNLGEIATPEILLEIPVEQIRNLPARGFEPSKEQEVAIAGLVHGKSFCLIGKAGTGKTTTVKHGVLELERSHRIGPMWDTDGHKYLRTGSLGVVCVAYTNRAINNISKSFDLATTRINFMTIHKLLEYIRETETYIDPETQELKNRAMFVPSRNKVRKLPRDLRVIIIEESSMVSTELHAKLKDACHPGMQFVYLGDLQQLPPPYGEGILGYKLNELPVLELTKIYRQAAENPIIRLAWDISTGKTLTQNVLEKEYAGTAPDSSIKISFFQKKIEFDFAVVTMGNFFCTLIDKCVLDPMQDVILVPYNKQLGSIELNKRIAQHVSEKAGMETYEIIAGFTKHYYAVGDKVLYNKKEGIIRKIVKNAKYVGKSPLPPSVDLHRDGSYHAKDSSGALISPEAMSEEDVDRMLMTMMENSEEDVQNQASHIIHLDLMSEQMEDGTSSVAVSTRGEYANLLLAYAITIHKAQGSEWRKVFLLMHNSHRSLNREMIYTAVTRASVQIFIMCEKDTFIKAVARQRIPGVTLQEKILWFKNKIEELRRKVEAAKTAGKKLRIIESDEDEDNL